MKRLIAMLLASVMCLSLLVGCGGKTTADNTPVVITVDEEEVKASELAAYIIYNMQYYQSMLGMDASYFADAEVFDGMKENCKEQAVSYRAVNKLAEQLGVKLDKDDQATLAENKKANEEYMGAETGSFAKWLKYSVKGDENPFVTYLNSFGYTEELYDANCETVQLESAIGDYYYDNGDTADYFKKNYVHAKSILIADTDDDGQALTGDKLEKAKAKAEKVLKRIQDGEDFDKLWEKYNSDTAQPDNGYYFTEGDMVDEYYKASKALKADEISKELVYHEGYGWFIIKGLALEDSALTDPNACLDNASATDTADADKVTISDKIGKVLMDEALQEVKEGMKVETTDEYDKITVRNVNTYLPFTMDSLFSGSGSAATGSGSAA